ncbi:MAG: GNAT family N-acetyltransferase [Clostridia bacterium]|nr:GNAT family N-acetyltransferase [Clostridia bacterium]
MDYIIRPVRPEDAEAISEFRRLPKVMEYTYALPSERVRLMEEWLGSMGPDNHDFVAEADGRAVGVAGVQVARGKRRHVGELGISVHDAYQGYGIGRALMETLLDLADNYLGLIRVELEVFADNTRAISLYESLGFELEGRKRKAVFRRGGYIDVLVMGRIREPRDA